VRVLLPMIILTLVACGPTPNAPSSAQRESSSAREAPKTLTIAQLNSIKNYGPWSFSSTPGGGSSLAEIHTISLTSEDNAGNIEPRVAAKLPSIEDGTIVFLPDGRMQTTWKLRPDVRWHDGVPLTADDLVFSWEIATHPETASSIEPAITKADSVTAPDPLTLVVTWKGPFYRALEIGHRDLWPVPRRLVGEAFQGDKQAFLAQPYFNTEYVALGPFRLVDFGLGENQMFERFDDFFLGRPKVSTIILKTIADPNVVMANLRAGAIDIAAEKTLPSDLAIELRDEWRSGGGTLVDRQDNWLRFAVQFGLQWAEPPELSRDVRVRRALLQSIDRDALREFVLPGFANTSGDTFLRASDPRGSAVGLPFDRYRYDPTQAAQLFADAGWRRRGDGWLANQDGAPVHIEARGFPIYAKDVSIAADYWRQQGIDVSELIPSTALSRDVEWRSKFPGLDTHDRGNGDQIFVSFDSRTHALPENRFIAANSAHYGQPALDRIIDRLYSTVDTSEQGRVLREAADLLAEDVAVLPLYFRVSFAAMRQGIRAMIDDYPGTRGSGAAARHAWLWERD
jgi:peptide/nickel transport system substrate-binding protein